MDKITSITCEITLEFWEGVPDLDSRRETIDDLIRMFNKLSSDIGVGDGADKYTSIRTTRTQ